jgi:NADH dehydrogenase [ubiquinone] 1 alpha subcomplex assembly factor 1
MDASFIITTAIATGVPLFNAGNAAGCAEVYCNAVVDLMDVASLDTRPSLSETLESSFACQNDTDRAWLLRRALDSALAGLRATSGCKLDLTKMKWTVVDDRVMGGKSQSQMIEQGDGAVVFAGELVVAGGGFASIRANLPSQGFFPTGSRGVVIQCNGDGRAGYKMIVKTDDSFDGIFYQASLPCESAATSPSSFTLPFSSFRATFRGQPISNAPPLHGDSISVIGFMLSHVDDAGRYTSEPAGAFCLRISSLSIC